MNELASKSNGKVVVVKLESTGVEDAKAVAATIQKNEGKIDVVIANAGIAKYYGPVSETPLSEIQDHFDVNVKGAIILYQAIYALLSKSAEPKFIYISSFAGSIGINIPIPVSA